MSYMLLEGLIKPRHSARYYMGLEPDQQDVQVAFAVAQRGYVLENGRIVLEGSMSELADSARVKDAYLGG